jgi:hypothetical protein
MLPAIVVYGFLGLDPTPTSLVIRPCLPKACPTMGISNVLYRGVRLDVQAADGLIVGELKDHPLEPVAIELDGKWKRAGTADAGSRFLLDVPGLYRFER